MRQVTELDKWLIKPDEPTPEEIEIHHNEQHRLQREQLERKKIRDDRERAQRATYRQKLRQNYYDQIRDKLLDYKDGKEPRVGPLVTFFDHLFLGPGNNYLKGKPFLLNYIPRVTPTIIKIHRDFCWGWFRVLTLTM